MKPEKFAALKGPDGKPVVTIMGDPDVSVVSLVPRGANGRQFGVAKADLGANEGPELNGGAMGVTPAEVGMMRRFLAFFTGGTVTDTTAKSEDEPAKSFAEALAPQVFWDRWWNVTSALRESVESVMEDPMLTDKPAEIRKRFSDAATYLVSQLPAANPLGLEMVAKAHREADDCAAVFVAKAGKVLSTKNKAAVTSAIAALQAVLDAADSSTTAAKAADNQEDEHMALDQNRINAVVTAAVTAYKAANPGATDAQLQNVVAKAAEVAAKASITPDQPARPTGQLEGEIADAGAGLQAASLQAMIDRAMAPIMATVAKQAERIAELESVLAGAPVTDDKGVVAKSADGAELRQPGLIDVLTNVGKSIEGIAGRVSAMERAVPAGNAGRIETNRDTASKADDVDAALRSAILGGAK
jgi:hypothetical protein